jgi:hypothetical protein
MFGVSFFEFYAAKRLVLFSSKRLLLFIFTSCFTFLGSLRCTGSSFFGLGLLIAASLSISTGRGGLLAILTTSGSGYDEGRAGRPEGFF